MVELTPNLVGNSFLVLMISYVIVFAFQIYMMYLNWKQSRVNDQMKELVDEVKAIRHEIAKLKLKK